MTVATNVLPDYGEPPQSEPGQDTPYDPYPWLLGRPVATPADDPIRKVLNLGPTDPLPEPDPGPGRRFVLDPKTGKRLPKPKGAGIRPGLAEGFRKSVTSAASSFTPAAVSGDVGQFMRAISGIESGSAEGNYQAQNPGSGAYGRFQIMPDNWAPWAKEAGLGAGAPRSAENQNHVAQYKMQQYYRQFGEWPLVAVAWFAGPGRAAAIKRHGWNSPQAQRILRFSDGHTTVREYVDRITRGMG